MSNEKPGALTSEDREALQHFIAIFTAPEFKPFKQPITFSERSCFPCCEYAESVWDFVRVVCERGIAIKHDWSYVAVKEFYEHPETLKQADAIAIRKYIFTMIRAERFNDGVMGRVFENGGMVNALKRLSELTA